MTEIRDLLHSARQALHRGEDDVAAALCRRALSENAGDAEVWTLLGTALRRREPGAAEVAFRRALAADTANADAQFHLANLLREQGRLAEAITLYRQALARLPGHPSLLNNLGLALFGAGEYADAERAYRSVLARAPDHRQALANLLHLLCARRRFREAIGVGERFLARHADPSIDFWIDYGIARHAQCDLDAAAEAFRHAAKVAPQDRTALANLGTVLIDMGNFVDAEPVLAAARSAAPDDLHVLSLLAHCRAHLCQWDSLGELHAAIASRLASEPGSGINPFLGLAMPMSAAMQRQNARHWGASLQPSWTLAPALVRERGTRLRLGYVSSDFRDHAIAYLATEVWERHDRRRFATFAYAIGVPDRSPARERIRAAFATFRECHDLASEEVARRIRDDGIDVLVDLNGYTAHARSEILAARPARVQVQWLGYLGTMGARWIDWIVTDREATPPAAQAFFDERFLYLPHCYCPSDTRRPVAPHPPDRPSCGLPSKGLVFCCFNNPSTLLPDVFDIWMRLLDRVPRSVLWLSPSNAVATANLGREAARRGVAPARLVFAPRVPVAQHLARHVHADLYLDTTPYNAGTAANDALFMGIPVLTCAGETMASRVAASQLCAIGMPHLVARDPRSYEERALALARSIEEMRSVKDELARNRRTHPLFDMVRFTSDLETALISAAG